MLAVFFRQTKTTLVTNLAKSVYRKMIAITSFTLAETAEQVLAGSLEFAPIVDAHRLLAIHFTTGQR